jgi:hypothetical protein
MYHENVVNQYKRRRDHILKDLEAAKSRNDQKDVVKTRGLLKILARAYMAYLREGVYRRGEGLGERNRGYVVHRPVVRQEVNEELRVRAKKTLAKVFGEYREAMHYIHGGNVTYVLHKEFLQSIPHIAESVAASLQADATYADYVSGPTISLAKSVAGKCVGLLGITQFLPVGPVGLFKIPVSMALHAASAAVTDKMMVHTRTMLQENATKQKIQKTIEATLRQSFEKQHLNEASGPLAKAFASVLSAGVFLANKVSNVACHTIIPNMVTGATDAMITKFLQERITYHLGQYNINKDAVIPLIRKHTATITAFIQGKPNLDHKILAFLQDLIDIVDISFILAYFRMHVQHSNSATTKALILR